MRRKFDHVYFAKVKEKEQAIRGGGRKQAAEKKERSIRGGGRRQVAGKKGAGNPPRPRGERTEKKGAGKNKKVEMAALDIES
ncbi:hypothetical protein BH11BAC7_BH11BAC7_14620 [soil metagenome]